MKQKRFRTLLLAAALLLGTLQPAMQVGAAAYEFRAGANGKQYWYENGVKQGTTSDTLGIMGDGTNRGREIYDPNTNEWYWLDSCYDGAKAEGKEVWIPYIYQEELTTAPGGNGRIANGISSESKIKELAAASVTDEADMSAQVEASIRNRTGKWVRYDENGAMIKGWCVITGKLADCYKDQEGNRYYYDQKTGLMAKGDVTIGGKTYHFDETSGVCTNYDEVNSRSATSTNNWALSAQEEEVYRKIIALKDSAYPEGMTWTNKNCYTSKARGSDDGVATIGLGCHGFALAASDAAFGDAPIHFLKNPNQIRVGDILRINNNSHTVIAIGFDATGITIAEGNYNSSIHWGRKLAWSVLDTCDYIYTRYTDNWEGTKRPTAEQTEAALSEATKNAPTEALTLINEAREEAGLSALTMDDDYRAVAQEKAVAVSVNADYNPTVGSIYIGFYRVETAEDFVDALLDYYPEYLLSDEYTSIGIGFSGPVEDSTYSNCWIVLL